MDDTSLLIFYTPHVFNQLRYYAYCFFSGLCALAIITAYLLLLWTLSATLLFIEGVRWFKEVVFACWLIAGLAFDFVVGVSQDILNGERSTAAEITDGSKYSKYIVFVTGETKCVRCGCTRSVSKVTQQGLCPSCAEELQGCISCNGILSVPPLLRKVEQPEPTDDSLRSYSQSWLDLRQQHAPVRDDTRSPRDWAEMRDGQNKRDLW